MHIGKMERLKNIKQKESCFIPLMKDRQFDRNIRRTVSEEYLKYLKYLKNIILKAQFRVM